ncbi:MAG: RNA polymerase sigma factor [Motilibacteraceae bacterium]
MDPDELLLARSATDPAAFEPLVHRHSPALYAYLARRVPSAAEDLLSEVWLSAYAGRGTYDAGRGPARGWLFGIARNAVVTHLRRPTALPLGYGGAEDPGWDDVDDRLDAHRRAPALSAAIRSLPSTERELLLLVALDGLSPTEAGAALGIPPGTARSRLHRARARIREQLDEDKPSPTALARRPRPSSFLPGAMP